MDEGAEIFEKPKSHLYKMHGHKIEHISNRLIGLVYINYRTKWLWSGWKQRWMELHNDKMVFFKYTLKKKHYKMFNISFENREIKYTVGGLQYDGDMYIIPMFKNNNKKFLIKTPHITGANLLYPLIDSVLNNKPNI